MRCRSKLENHWFWEDRFLTWCFYPWVCQGCKTLGGNRILKALGFSSISKACLLFQEGQKLRMDTGSRQDRSTTPYEIAAHPPFCSPTASGRLGSDSPSAGVSQSLLMLTPCSMGLALEDAHTTEGATDANFQQKHLFLPAQENLLAENSAGRFLW